MQKLLTIFVTVLCLIITTKAISQESATDLKYRRSSLSMIIIENKNLPNKDAVLSSWTNYPFPDKYNKHVTNLKSINIDNIKLSEQEIEAANLKKEKLNNGLQAGKTLNNATSNKLSSSANSVAGKLPMEKTEYQMMIDKVITSEKLANKLVASWFNRSPDGKFNMKLIQERGFYNASEMEAGIAKGQAKGLASLGDAGEELLRNTFVTFTKLDFIENEPAALKARDAAKKEIQESMTNSPKLLVDKALKGADNAYDKAKEGYSLWSKTWLYQLKWNDSIAAIFYNDLWSNPKAFDNSNLFSLEFVGVQYNQSLVTFKIGEKRTQEQIIDLALVRNVDNAFAELQKENEVFRPKVPVLSADPITAQIGMKEGLEGGEQFDVLEMVLNQKTGRTEYKVVGSATVDKKIVWDNRYNAGDKSEVVLDKNGAPITATLFKGGKNIQPGMLLKQKR
ncbi:MAG: hypothetical protein WAU12_03860 [Saprospiraceae bacterium]|jgi:hypothetical protein|uniref:hypothetical protein n=1 Tax=Candidatus Brachybacter algidus TaxID=2982024 RepID=UPI001B6B61E2|nr:hypothetical protein [Candidatus Brachybacter algidus]MBP7306284.1 hypothetical protein [Saprospiraceae bacterium]MBK6375048.1 hypothetical protein [Candidatus Brachybacter algidus]MBK6450459.1 hypothetical protein [Candidatus Brachybacter algidus]MBK7605234.1 hypothetical protein [Candidatus Brachybacter algidus]MBK8356129.1 hypothetical protein [Candidatus Brachybacter algidus]